MSSHAAADHERAAAAPARGALVGDSSDNGLGDEAGERAGDPDERGVALGEAELEEIVRIGQAGEDAKALVSGGSEATERLLSDYDGLEKARMARTPRTAPQCTYYFFLLQTKYP